MRIVYSNIFLLLLIFSSCTDTSPNANSDLANYETQHAQLLELDSPTIANHVGTPLGLTPVASNDMPYSMVYAQFVDAQASEQNWLESSKAIFELKERLAHTEPELAYSYLDQMAALQIVGRAAIDSMFINYQWNDEEIELLSSQVEVLINNRNPQASLIAPALKQLHGYWPDAQLREAALIAANAATTWIEADRTKDLHEGVREVNEALFYRLYAEAAEELRVIATPITSP